MTPSPFGYDADAAREEARRLYADGVIVPHLERLIAELDMLHADRLNAEIMLTLPRGAAARYGVKIEPGTEVLGYPAVEDDVEVPTARRR